MADITITITAKSLDELQTVLLSLLKAAEQTATVEAAPAEAAPAESKKRTRKTKAAEEPVPQEVDSKEVAEQDEADEQAVLQFTETYSRDDVRAAMTRYSKMYGLENLQLDLPKIFSKRFDGTAHKVTKLS